MPPAHSPAPSLYLTTKRAHRNLGWQNECLLWSLEASASELSHFSGPQSPHLSSEGSRGPPKPSTSSRNAAEGFLGPAVPMLGMS